MKKIFVLISGGSAGKTTIIKNLSPKYSALNNFLLVKRDSSPQEQCKFCKFEETISVIKRIIKITENKVKREKIENYSLVIPFTLKVKDGKLGVNCIIKPLEYLKSVFGENLYVIHVNRYQERLTEVNEFIKKNLNPALTLISDKQGNKSDNPKKLKEFIISKFN